MADDSPDTPDEKPAPKPRARRAPAKTAATPAASKPQPTSKPAAASKPKPAATKAPPKPRSSKRTAAPRTAKTTTARAKKVATQATDKVGGKWGVAAIAGGVVAAAGAAAALLTLRSSTPRDTGVGKPTGGAKQADGTDSSKSFEAGIADEGSIPKA